MKIVHSGTGFLLAAFLLFMSMQKFGDANPVFQYMAEQSGIALFEPTIRMLVGVAEIGAAVLIVLGLTLGMLRGVGALVSAGVIGGAIVFHLSPWLGINAPVAFDEAGNYVTSPMLFTMALAFFALSAFLLWLEKDSLLGLLGRGQDTVSTDD